MNGLRSTSRRCRVAVASLSGALALTAWVGVLAPAHAQVEAPLDTAPVDQIVDTVNDTVDQTSQIVDTVQGTVDGLVNDVREGVRDKLPALPVDLPVLDLPDVPDLPALPTSPRPTSATGTPGSRGEAAYPPGVGTSPAASTPGGAGAGDGRGPSGRTGRRAGSARAGEPRLMSTAEVIALLEAVGAPDETVARILSPFPAGGLAEYADDGSDRSGVDLTLTGTVPVTAGATGWVSGIVPGEGGELIMTIADTDGREYRYGGIDPTARPLEAGTAVEPGAVIGTADGVLGFDAGRGTLAFLGEALEHARAEAVLYATGVRISRALFGGNALEVVPAASVTPVAVPKPFVLAAAALLTVVSLGLAWAARGDSRDPARFVRALGTFAPARA